VRSRFNVDHDHAQVDDGPRSEPNIQLFNFLKNFVEALLMLLQHCFQMIKACRDDILLLLEGKKIVLNWFGWNLPP
jgi:hypothetical protein